jgi:hypothetical protein
MRAMIDAPAVPDREMALDVQSGAVRVASDDIPLPDGPLTLECWLNADAFAQRTGLVAKTENSEYAIFVNAGVPSFSIFLGDRYVEARSAEPALEPGRWHHVAGVFDGGEVRLYVDGRVADRTPGSGARRTNTLPLIVGADVNARGDAVSHFDGQIDEVRLSGVARYEGDGFTPRRRARPDEHTLLLLHMDGAVGPWLHDASGRGAHGVAGSGVAIVEARR